MTNFDCQEVNIFTTTWLQEHIATPTPPCQAFRLHMPAEPADRALRLKGGAR